MQWLDWLDFVRTRADVPDPGLEWPAPRDSSPRAVSACIAGFVTLLIGLIAPLLSASGAAVLGMPLFRVVVAAAAGLTLLLALLARARGEDRRLWAGGLALAVLGVSSGHFMLGLALAFLVFVVCTLLG